MMYRLYLLFAILVFSVYGWAQFQGYPLIGSSGDATQGPPIGSRIYHK